MSRDNLLMVADSERDANMLYAVRMFVPDSFVYLRLNGKCHMVVSDLELDRARREARHCRVHSLSACLKTLRQKGARQPGLPHVIRQLLQRFRLKKVFVPDNFSLALARELRRLKVQIKLKSGQFFPQRELKTAEEVKKINAALMMAEGGLAEGIQVLRNAKVGRNRRLMHHNLPLTAEKLRAIINTAVLQAGGIACHTIVAGGAQACDPHEEGHGVLRAREPIILDVFPRSQKTGYFGDITRTVIKGRATDAQRRLYHIVERAQEVAMEHMRNRGPSRVVHERVQEFFRKEGYVTGKRQGRWQGFFHGTGHGLGLEVHEAPYIGAASTDMLRARHVVTVEPALYYAELGAVRLEDVAIITHNGPRTLTQFEKVFEV